MPVIRKPFTRSRRSHVLVDVHGKDEPSTTQQHMKDDADINNILRKYDKHDLLMIASKAVSNYGDFTAVNEFQEAMNLVIRAQSDFDALPSSIRSRFRNDPGYFLEFATNPQNAQEMIRLGLASVDPARVPTPAPAPASAPASTAPAQ